MTSPNRWFLISGLICAAIAGLPFLPGLHGSFVFDDVANIVSNQAVQISTLNASSISDVAFGKQPGGISRVLPTLSFAFDFWRSGGLDPVQFKITNIFIHTLTTLALTWLFREILLSVQAPKRKAQFAALALALAWAVHPLQVSSVLYVVQRMETMCTFFIVLSLLSYVIGRREQLAGRPGRVGWLLALLFWVVAAGCKEDAALLPIYALALELTVFGFAAANPQLAGRLRKGYMIATFVGMALYLFVVAPHFWSSSLYPGRDFSSSERLLTQARVLCMYLWEILVPLPSHMPFYYDWVQPSKDLFHPWTTLPSIVLLVSLLIAAWVVRKQHRLFALGVFLFFAGHFMASNVLGLEMAFEHRNHFPLIGAVLAIGDLLVLAAQYLRFRPAMLATTCTLLLIGLSGATISRASMWGSEKEFVYRTPQLAPQSARAWYSLCIYYYDLGGGKVPGNPYIDKAIDTCRKGAAAAPYSLTNITSLLTFKAWRGLDTRLEWAQYLERLQHVNLGPENNQSIWTIINNFRAGIPFDENNVFKAIDIVLTRKQLDPGEYAAIGYFTLGRTRQPDRAYPYFARAVEMLPPGDPHTIELITDLDRQGRTDWARKLETIDQNRTAHITGNGI
ncbi:hypothetical protein [Solilutibacter silvestris]|uniref:hypothetical protein n=1 Tax=Solilutibacter silvestris TaxID=1645665 RepID=UPI003D34F7B8